MSDRGIAAAGAYAPDRRIPAAEFADAWGQFEASGIEEKAVPEADEDALTMAWEAGRRALGAAGLEGSEVDALAFATTTPPLEEEDLTARLGSALGVPGDAARDVYAGSTRAGTRALFGALAADGPALVVASDCPRGEPADAREHAAGAGAAAFVVEADAPVAVEDRAEYAAPYPGTRFRERADGAVEGLDITSYDRGAFRETLAGAVDGVEAGDVDAAAVQAPDGGLPYRAAGSIGVDAEAIQACATVHELGDTGAASVALSIASALADGHERILGAAFGSGAGADALVLAGTAPTDLALSDGRTLTYAEYLRQRGEITPGLPDGGGAYVSVPAWQRSIPQRHRLVAGACPSCGALTFPPEGACTGCGKLVEYERVELPREGTVEAVTAISRGGEPPEFAEQQARSGEYGVAIASFERGGGAASLPVQVTDGGTDLEVGDSVWAVLRRIYTQEGVTRYGMKVRADDA